MSQALFLLRELKQCHDEMVERIDVFDWQGVGTIWQMAEARFSDLKRLSLVDLLVGDERAEAHELIETLLDRQKFISDQASTWMDQVRPLLSSFERHPVAVRREALPS
ncbi:MAG: hypothetical protein LBL72_10350 [Candidatus Accumulibacter sp.]|jgi:hypothetical protein|nr:hypothetical protein [Accumulibacter sp.]